jgi:hypothetical protein
MLGALPFAAPAFAQNGAPTIIVEPSGSPRPEYSKARDPSAAQLIETWRSSNRFMTEKKVDNERFEVIDRRVVNGRISRAFVQFRILSAGDDAASFAARRCPGRTRPVEIQVYYQWSDDLRAWTPLNTRGDGTEDLCSGGKLWTAEQVGKLVNPPPLPDPPRISMASVYTPRPGSPERAAIMDALRPRYEAMFGAPIVFRVDTLRVAAGFAYVVVHAQRPDGAPIAKSTWKKALGGECFQSPASVTHEYWMRRDRAAWVIGVKNDMCADDSISQQGDLIGAPPQLMNLPAWPEREFMPEPD